LKFIHNYIGVNEKPDKTDTVAQGFFKGFAYPPIPKVYSLNRHWSVQISCPPNRH